MVKVTWIVVDRGGYGKERERPMCMNSRSAKASKKGTPIEEEEREEDEAEVFTIKMHIDRSCHVAMKLDQMWGGGLKFF